MEDTVENNNEKSEETTILHDYWDLKGPWEEEEEIQIQESTSNEPNRSLPSRVLNFGILSISGLLNTAGFRVGRPSRGPSALTSTLIPPALSHHIESTASDLYKTQLQYSEDGERLLVMQNSAISVRYSNQNFEVDHIIWQVPEPDPQPQWRRVAMSRDGKLVAMVTSEGDVYIVSHLGNVIFSSEVEKLGIEEGVVAIEFRDSICELEGTSKCSELLILGFDGKLRRIHILVSKEETTAKVHPIPEDGVKSCSESTKIVEMQSYHGMVTCMSFHAPSNVLAVGGTQSLEADSLSFWKISDKSPYAELIHSTQSNTNSGGFLGSLKQKFYNQESKNILHKLSFSPSGQYVAALDLLGNVTVFQVGPFSKVTSIKNSAVFDFSWWSDKVIVLSKMDGEISISCISESGDMISPSNFKPKPVLSCTRNEKFFILKHEEKIVDSRSVTDRLWNEEEQSGWFDSVVSVISFGYFSNDVSVSSRRQNPTKKIKKKYTLVCFTKTTPEALYKRQISIKQFDSALETATKFNLNTDPVYQQKWFNSLVTQDSIQSLLEHIKDTEWQLLECQRRIPFTVEGCKLLLEHGLNMTHNKNYLYRLLYLNYLIRLQTYAALSDNQFDSQEFLVFRDCNLVEVASTIYAYEEHFHALKVLFTYHGEELLPYRLYILEHIPETTPPENYEEILPSVKEGHEVVWEQNKWREKDPVQEDEEVLKSLNVVDVGNVMELKTIQWNMWKSEDKIPMIRHLEIPEFTRDTYEDFRDPTDTPKFSVTPEYIPQYPVSGTVLTEWYSERARKIEENSGQVDNALELVDIGMRKGIEGLETLFFNLKVLNMLVYTCDVDISLAKFETLSDFEKFSLLLTGANAENIVSYIKERGHLLLDKETSINETNSAPSTTNILHKYMVDQSKSGDLSLCESIFISSKPTDPLDQRIIKNPLQLLETALACVYECKDMSQLDKMDSIFKCLPDRNSVDENDLLFKNLQDRTDAFGDHLSSTEILCKYKILMPLEFFVQVKEDETKQEEAKELISQICNNCIHAKVPLYPSQWRSLITELLELRDKVFQFIPTQYCYINYFEALLKTGTKEYVKEVQDVEPLILTISREYFNASISGDDANMKKAKKVLDLAPVTTPDIIAELNLNKAVTVLYGYGISPLPVEIRNNEKKIEYIQQVLETSSDAYKNPTAMVRLASQLTKTDSKTNSWIHMQIAKAALKLKDYNTAFDTCINLIKANYNDIWTVCKELGCCKEFPALEKRMQMLSFAMTQCPLVQVESMLNTWRSLESKLTYNQFGIEAKEKSSTLLKFKEVVKKTSMFQKSNTPKKSLFSFSDGLFYLEECLNYYNRNFVNKPIKGELPSLEEINQKIVRLNANYGGEIIDNDDLLVELADQFILQDTPLSLAYLFSLYKPLNATKLFDRLMSQYTDNNSTEQIVTFACYFFHLKLLSISSLSASRVTETEKILHQMSPKEAVMYLDEKLKEEEQKQSEALPSPQVSRYNLASSVDVETVEALKKELKHYSTLLLDTLKAKDILSLGHGVDLNKFAKDETYKYASILSFTHTLDQETLKSAFALGSQYGVSNADMAVEYLEWLLVNHNLERGEYQEKMKEFVGLIPAKYGSKLENEVYTKIPPTNYQAILYFFDVLTTCYRKLLETDPSIQESLDKLTEKISLATSLSKIRPLVDFRSITSPNANLIAILEPILSENNVFNFAKLKLADLNPAQLFKIMLKKTMEKHEDIEEKYDDCIQYMERVDLPDLLDFVETLIANEDHPLSIKKKSIEDSLTIIQRRQSSKKVKINTEEAQEAENKLKQMATHLGTLQKLDHLRDSNPVYFAMLEQCANHPDKLYKALIEIAASGIHIPLFLHILQVVLNVKNEEDLAPKLCEIYSKMFDQVLTVASNNKEEEEHHWPPICSSDSYYYLANVLVSISGDIGEEIDENNPNDLRNVLGALLVEKLDQYFEDTNNPVPAKISFLQIILDPSFTRVTKNYHHKFHTLLEDLQASNIIGNLWNKDIHQSKETLFNQLLENSPTYKHLENLGELWNIWTEENLSSSLWHKYLILLINRKEFSLLLKRKGILSLEEEEDVAKRLEESCVVAYYKFSLKSSFSSVLSNAIKKLGDSNVAMDEELVLLIISSDNVLPKIANTKIFASFQEYLVQKYKSYLAAKNRDEVFNYELALGAGICKLVIGHAHSYAGELLLNATSYFSSFSLFFSIDGGLAQLKKYLISLNEMDSDELTSPSAARKELGVFISAEMVKDLAFKAADVFQRDIAKL